MNEDERGITPADVTAMTAERCDDGWQITVEQGNGDVVKLITLTDMERIQLSIMLDGAPGEIFAEHCSFLDPTRPWIMTEVERRACPSCNETAAHRLGECPVF